MYNIISFLLSLNSYSDSRVVTIFVLSVVIVFLLRKISKIIKFKTEKGLIFNRTEKITTDNYSLAFEEVESLSKLPAKSISVATKGALLFFSLVLVFTPLYNFIETLRPQMDYSNSMCCMFC